MASKFLDAALRYLDLGFAVLILGHRAKKPVTAHTPDGLDDATRDEATVREWWGKTPKCNVGASLGAPSGGIIAIDIDRKDGVDGYETMRDWEMEHGDLPETAICCTPTGGYHLYYRADRHVAPSVNKAIGVDVRGDGSLAVLPPSVHPDTGTEYVWEFPPEDGIADADERVYEFIEFARPDDERADRGGAPHVDASDFGKGNRNNKLYKMACGLMAQSWPDDAIVASIETYNAHAKDPLPQDEVDKLLRSALKLPKGKSEQFYKDELARASGGGTLSGGGGGRGRSRKFDHAAIARKLMADNGACLVDGMPAIRSGHVYEIGWNAVSREIVKLDDQATRANQKEVHHYLTVMGENRRQSPPNLIAFRNGVLDVLDMGLTPWERVDPGVVIPNIIPHDWDGAAEFAEVDKTLLKLSCDESDVLESLIEVMGVCMYRSNEFTQSAILLGTGSNGKSTYIRMLQNMLGRDNVASLDMSMLGKQFYTGHLAGKLANLGDDISNEFQRGDYLSVFKKLVDGNRVYADVKGTEGFEFESYATLVFSANEFPRLADYSDGMIRRIFPIEFNARFDKADADYDPRISSKLRSEEACRRMCVLGVSGLQQVIERNGFSPNAASSRRVEEIRADNDTTLAWAVENGWTRDGLDGRQIDVLYKHYKDWCDESGLQFVKRTKFTRLINKNYDLVSASGRVSGSVTRCFRKREAV